MVTRLSLILGCFLLLATVGPATANSLRAPDRREASTRATSSSWARPTQISDISMDELASAVDSTGNVYAVGSSGLRGAPLYLLTNASGAWVQSSIARSARKGAFAGVNVAVSSNNIRNAFTPFGNADVLLAAFLLLAAGHLGGADTLHRVLDMVASLKSRVLRGIPTPR